MGVINVETFSLQICFFFSKMEIELFSLESFFSLLINHFLFQKGVDMASIKPHSTPPPIHL